MQFLYPVLIAIMLLMGCSMAFLIYYGRRSENILQRLIAYVIFGMMTGMFVGPLVYLYAPGSLTVAGAAEVSLAGMAFLIIPFLFVFLRDVTSGNQLRARKGFLAYIAVSVLLDEVLMSLVFNMLLLGTIFVDSMHSDPLNAIFLSISSYWFVVPMSIEMFLTILFIFRDLKKQMILTFGFQAAIMLFSPAAFQNAYWAAVSIYLSGSLMTAYFVFAFEYLYRKQSIRSGFARYLLLLILAYAAMMAGVFDWQAYGSTAILSAGMLLNMLIYLYAVLPGPGALGGKQRFWLADRNWTFSFLLLVFVAELFMGGSFDLLYFGSSSYIGALGLVSISGSVLNVLGAAFFDFISFVGIIALSPWFLVMMGVEMGSLVVFKIRITREPETRIRMVLMLAAYAVYSIYVPSFLVNDPSLVPFVGWPMGIGSGGGFSLVLIIPIGLTYLVSGILSILFGSRQLCSTFCTAPVMYQGTFYDSMKKFNKSGKLAPGLTTSTKRAQLSYRMVSFSVYALIIGSGILSYLDASGIENVTFYGMDPEYFLYIFLFGFLWYAVFILIPFVGSYGCINTGYCHWGNFNRFLSKFGFFRLKVRSTDVCVSCKTRDCATACPVGNYGQPGSFISTGIYRDSRCVGIGDCVNACPYENIFYYDVRHWIRDRISKKQQ